MKQSVMALLAFGLVLMTSCTSHPKHVEMQQRLHQLSAFNQADSLFTSVEHQEAQALVTYFDRHGTSNQQVLAHYLLGRSYADLHEAPMALQCYQDAVALADTTTADCDFAQLSRVYGQAATIFYQQNLYRQQLDNLANARQYAWQAGDTVAALLFYAHRALGYDNMQMEDSSLFVYQEASRLLSQYGYQQLSAGFSGVIAEKMLARGRVKEAGEQLRNYETSSGFFDEEGNVAPGREIYYYWKGLYLMEVQRYDAAENYFRKELREGRDFNAQNSGAYGLSQLFLRTHRPDSAAKYAVYAYAMNDSLYAATATDAVLQAKSMYEYTRHQKLAQQEKERADRERRLVWILSAVAVLLLAAAVLIFWWQSVRRRQAARRYQQLSDAYEHTLSEIQRLRHIDERLKESRRHEEALSRMILEKEQTARQQQRELARYKLREQEAEENRSKWRKRLSNDPVFEQLSIKAAAGQLLTATEWVEIENLIARISPEFSQFLMSKSHLLSTYEHQICVLTCLFVRPKQIACLIGVDGSYISKMRTAIVKKLFDGDKSKELDSSLMEIC
jgi:tetratricopeptide (TPR) repeat protein